MWKSFCWRYAGSARNATGMPGVLECVEPDQQKAGQIALETRSRSM
jgi:hypothetical protein